VPVRKKLIHPPVIPEVRRACPELAEGSYLVSIESINTGIPCPLKSSSLTP